MEKLFKSFKVLSVLKIPNDLSHPEKDLHKIPNIDTRIFYADVLRAPLPARVLPSAVTLSLLLFSVTEQRPPGEGCEGPCTRGDRLNVPLTP